MPTATTNCPRCDLDASLWFSEDTENGAPHGAGYWPMEVKDAGQMCDCELTEEEVEVAEKVAWNAFSNDPRSLMALAYDAQLVDDDPPAPAG